MSKPTISEWAMQLRERTKHHMSERIAAAINAELVNARTTYPANRDLAKRLTLQLSRMTNMVNNAPRNDAGDFELWTSGIVLMCLMTRFLEEGDPAIFDGLRSPYLESELDALDKATRKE